MTRHRAPSTAPLLEWPDRAAIEALEASRARLIARCNALRPHSHKRVALLARVADLTTEILAREARIIKTIPFQMRDLHDRDRQRLVQHAEPTGASH